MSRETAELIFYAGICIFGFIWLVATVFVFRKLRAPRREEYGRAEEVETGLLTGEVRVPGDQEVFSQKLAEQIASAPGLGVKITERTPARVAFEVVRAGSAKPSVWGRGAIMLRQDGEDIRARYAFDLGRLRAILRLVAFLTCFVYGGIFLVGVPAIIWFVVLPSEDSAVRWQVVQICQMVHGVWPPFLIGWLWSRSVRSISTSLETLISNVRHMV